MFTRVTHAAHNPCLAAVESHHSWAWVSSMAKKTEGHVNLWEENELETYLLGFQIFVQPFFKCCIQGVGPESCAGTQRKVIKQATLHLDKEHTAVGRPSEVSLPNFKLQKPKACGGGVVWWLGKICSGDCNLKLDFFPVSGTSLWITISRGSKLSLGLRCHKRMKWHQVYTKHHLHTKKGAKFQKA